MAKSDTWKEYREGCLGTFLGGYTCDGDEGKLEAFQHGMNTIFNVLEDTFPEPAIIWAAMKHSLELETLSPKEVKRAGTYANLRHRFSQGELTLPGDDRRDDAD